MKILVPIVVAIAILPYLRIEDEAIEDLGVKILRDLYHLPSDTKLQLIAEGFDLSNDAEQLVGT